MHLHLCQRGSLAAASICVIADAAQTFPAGEALNFLPSDMAILEAGEIRQDIPCTVTDRKAELGFDLRFHGGFDVSVPLSELAGNGEILTVVFRVFPRDTPARASYFVQHFTVPPIEEDAKGDALYKAASIWAKETITLIG